MDISRSSISKIEEDIQIAQLGETKHWIAPELPSPISRSIHHKQQQKEQEQEVTPDETRTSARLYETVWLLWSYSIQYLQQERESLPNEASPYQQLTVTLNFNQVYQLLVVNSYQ